jgi:aspartate ammonia-lyase
MVDHWEADMRFGEYLMSKGILSQQDVDTIADAQIKTNVWLGTLAYLYSYMDFYQIGQVLEAQARSGRRFGELAVELGFLTQAQLDELLDLQKRKRVKFGEVAVALKYLTSAQLRELLQEFHAQQNQTSPAE